MSGDYRRGGSDYDRFLQWDYEQSYGDRPGDREEYRNEQEHGPSHPDDDSHGHFAFCAFEDKGGEPMQFRIVDDAYLAIEDELRETVASAKRATLGQCKYAQCLLRV